MIDWLVLRGIILFFLLGGIGVNLLWIWALVHFVFEPILGPTFTLED